MFLANQSQAKIRSVDVANGNSLYYMYLYDSSAYQINQNLEDSPKKDILIFNYGQIDKPLIAKDNAGETRKIINSLNYFNLQYHTPVSDNNMLGFSLNYLNINLNEAQDESGIGDLSLVHYYNVYSKRKLNTALVTELSIPSGKEDSFLSTGKMEVRSRFLFEQDWEQFSTTASLGLRYSPGNVYENIDYTKSISYGIGIHLPISETSSFAFESLGHISNDIHSSSGESGISYTYRSSNDNFLQLGLSNSGTSEDVNKSLRLNLAYKKILGTSSGPAQNACVVEPVFITYFARPLSSEELEEYQEKLPYKSSVKINHNNEEVGIDTYSLGQKTGISKGGLPYVKNAQIPFAIDFTYFPDESIVRKVHFARLKMTVNKLHNDGYLGTESLCFLDYAICSGNPISQDHWAETLNTDFFKDGKNALNDNFGKIYLSKPVLHAEKEEFYSSQLHASLENLIQGSNIDLKMLLSNSHRRGALYLALADDTFPSDDIRLEISLEVEKCEY